MILVKSIESLIFPGWQEESWREHGPTIFRIEHPLTTEKRNNVYS